ncbi:hypothetical protein [Paracoccus wurundjeri]|uniref:hypothetical protein n=1 Tax=Paracoccus onubensis TaxID=1675788 RepID=UPI002730BFC8|nr:hypothetical protein [Paracoccus onubensis]
MPKYLRGGGGGGPPPPPPPPPPHRGTQIAAFTIQLRYALGAGFCGESCNSQPSTSIVRMKVARYLR